ncbi:Crp/Fnr family transcriptional regulator [Chitinophaga sancti]|uniref:Crp/Fnr family transcriptional regulator n=1 Tax=Chitinophaga sancti TaxID=1004 RepID=A0A1K1SMS4_9BACT|nr:Crp/Fnr family transcriptional regulator [Chitinophaga sancti]WQD60077.1 Crp/Fnr family transcriptional regulator [Chitinophaga sancti]WQG87795.1 Crp/Fnr family transcriptional regulator [Chitinophaga sancti]SFW85712.1 cAMP-binding domain of CRP or a regulatory subunit of cAMP-dependent protein kinases [Chitinophaga sancti]
MADFFQFCKQFSPLEDTVLWELSQHTITKTYPKGTFLLHSGDTCRYLYFVNEGLIKSFSEKGDKEFIMRFFSENLLFSVFDSYINQTPSKFNLVALEETTVTLIRHETMEALCRQHHAMETFFRKLVSIAATKMMKRISEMLEENATDRYWLFVEENNAIHQRISLGDIAKYLGITQQSLSRIRTTQ